jgi:hypothetical protein
LINPKIGDVNQKSDATEKIKTNGVKSQQIDISKMT